MDLELAYNGLRICEPTKLVGSLKAKAWIVPPRHTDMLGGVPCYLSNGKYRLHRHPRASSPFS